MHTMAKRVPIQEEKQRPSTDCADFTDSVGCEKRRLLRNHLTNNKRSILVLPFIIHHSAFILRFYSPQPFGICGRMKASASGQFLAFMFGESHSIFLPSRRATLPRMTASVIGPE